MHLKDSWLIDPAQIGDFYERMYRYLHEQGADFAKADGQCAIELICRCAGGRLGFWCEMRPRKVLVDG